MRHYRLLAVGAIALILSACTSTSTSTRSGTGTAGGGTQSGTAASAVGTSATGSPTLSVPAQAPWDTAVTLAGQGFPAGSAVTITASAVDTTNVTWSASAVFTASATGGFSTATPPVSGSYSAANAMGLFEFLAPPTGVTPAGTILLGHPGAGLNVALTASVAGSVVARTATLRQPASQLGVTETDLRPPVSTIYGDMFLPPHSTGTHTAVLMIGGSSGGLADIGTASLLAAHGYPTLALAYFKEPGLPATLANIPLEYFQKALTVLRSEPGVDPAHLVVSGDSRGAEAALLLGTTYPGMIHAVVAGSPSSVVNVGYPDTNRPAWTLDGKPIPAAPLSDWNEPSPADHPEAVIPVEKIAGPILLTCGTVDQVWNGCGFMNAITARLAAHSFAHPVVARSYSGAGHLAGAMAAYYSFTPAFVVGFGGGLVANQAALVDGRRSLLSFLGSA